MDSTVALGGANDLSNEVLLVAIPFPPNHKWTARLEALHPGLKVRLAIQSNTFPPEPLPKEVYDGVTILCTLWPHPVEMLQNVRYVQLLSAGADKWIGHELYKNPNVTFCTANGAHAYVGRVPWGGWELTVFTVHRSQSGLWALG